jgi:hypothetical protein
MKAHKVFGIVVRSIGLWSIVQGMASLVAILGNNGLYVAIAAAVEMLIGAVLFFGADGFVRTAYRHSLE